MDEIEMHVRLAEMYAGIVTALIAASHLNADKTSEYAALMQGHALAAAVKVARPASAEEMMT